MPRIELQTDIHAPRERVFDLIRSIDLHKHSAAQTNEEAIAGVTSGLIHLGEAVTWRARHLGVTQTLTSRVTAFKRPEYFVDEMVKGAFKRFKHEHILIEKDNSTLVVDIFDYTSPLGILGKIADVLFLENYMTQFLIRRNEVIKEFAETDKWMEVVN